MQTDLYMNAPSVVCEIAQSPDLAVWYVELILKIKHKYICNARECDKSDGFCIYLKHENAKKVD